MIINMDRTLVFRQTRGRLLKFRNSLVLRLTDNIVFIAYIFKFLTAIFVEHVNDHSKNMSLFQ